MVRRSYWKDPEKGRQRAREEREKFPEKVKARLTVSNAIVSGRLTRPNVCSECGKGGIIQAHHADYSKPFEIQWLCSTCHGKLRHLG